MTNVIAEVLGTIVINLSMCVQNTPLAYDAYQVCFKVRQLRFEREDNRYESFSRLIFILKLGLMEIIELAGEDQHLYSLVSHLVMDQQILSYNLNYPFRTSPRYRWFVAADDGSTIGFVPVKLEDGKAVINNYYVADDDADVFRALLREVIRVFASDLCVESVTQTRHQRLFESSGFSVVHYWKRFVKMKVYGDEAECV